MLGELVRHDRFEVLRQLGAGAFGVVYEAIDKSRDSRVALKVLKRLDAAALYRFKKEFRALADVAHPNLVQLYELISEGNQWFFTMELLEGVDFLTYVRGRPNPRHKLSTDTPFGSTIDVAALTRVDPLNPALSKTITSSPGAGAIESRQKAASSRADFRRLRHAMGQLAEAISALHQARILHRDIKPSNIIVTSDGRVVVLDFGIVAQIKEGSGSEMELLMGTPAYMAPEQGAQLPLTPAADWYAAGVVLFEALTGRLPFEGDALQLLMNKQQDDPPRPRDFVRSVPEDLDELCYALLRRSPEARPSEQELLRVLAPREGAPRTIAPTTAASVAVPLIGRTGALEELESALESVRKKTPETVQVHGASGMGKSALVRHFLDDVAARGGAVIFSGRCYERESVPYKAFDSVIDGLSKYLRKLPKVEVDKLMPRDPSVLARVFPVLERVPSIGDAPARGHAAHDPQQLRARAFGAFRELLARMADRQTVVIFIDDLQWGDVDSAALFAELTAEPDPPPLLMILAYRTEDEHTSVTLNSLRQARSMNRWAKPPRRIALEALSRDDARDLALHMLGGDPVTDALATSIAIESGGNPFFVGELVHYVQTDASRISATGLRLERVVQDRVRELPGSAMQLLEVISVAGRPIELEAAHRAAALPVEEREQALSTLRTMHLVRSAATTGSIETFHDRIRETVMTMLEPKELRAIHAALAGALLEAGNADPEVLFMHYRGAGVPHRAAEFARAAGTKAERALAFDRAAQFYRLALDLMRKEDWSVQQPLRILLAETLVSAGRGREAAEAFLKATKDAQEATQIELQRRAAEQLMQSGHVDRGIEVIREVLARVDLGFPETPFRALVTLIMLRLWLALRGLSFRERDAHTVSPRELMLIDVCTSISMGLAVVDNIRAQTFQSRGLLLSLRAGERNRLSRTLAMEAVFASTRGGSARARAYRLVEQAQGLADKTGTPEAKAIVELGRAAASMFTGHWKGAWDSTQAMLVMRGESRGMFWELATVQYFSLSALHHLGRLTDLQRLFQTYLRSAEERGDLFLLTNLRVGDTSVTWLIDDQPAQARTIIARMMERWSRNSFLMQHWYEMHSLAQIDLFEGKGDEAFDRVMATWPSLRRALSLRVQYTRVRAHFLRGRAALAAIRVRPQERDRLLAIARSDARTLLREGVAWAPPHAHLLLAGTHAIAEDVPAARRELELAIAGFEGVDMALYAAAAKRRLGAMIGGADGEAMAQAATDWMTSQGVKNPDRLTAMMAPGLRLPTK